ncbi:MAG TPA: DUF3617 family protein [Candidatus Binataceae bacterium]|nr:DUF3617 family protein [Candidatus Binataceae bacterium]
MGQSIIATLSLIVVASLASPVRGERVEFKATPGLWKVTYRTQVTGEPDPAIVKWRCVSEEQMDDPGTAFGKPAAPNGHCTRTSYSQTSKSISWKYACTGASAKLNSHGSITFDTRLHYTGKIKVEGTVMGYPIANTIAVEGVHRAACTSPED